MTDEIKMDCGPRSNDNWTRGTATCNGTSYEFNIKHFDERSEFGIGHGRISKLWLRRMGEARPELNFDRGWERGFTPRGKGAQVAAIYWALIARFN